MKSLRAKFFIAISSLFALVFLSVCIPRVMITSLLSPTNSNFELPNSSHDWQECTFNVGKDTVRGWWFQGEQNRPAVLLVHGIRENRMSMFSRGEYLAPKGWSVLNIDLPGHGMSSSRAVTLGLTESAVIAESYRWIHQRVPNSKIGVIGFSLGGASVLLGDSVAPFDAIVLEAVYSNVLQAIENRLSMKLGVVVQPAMWLMQSQFQSVTGINPDRLSPLQAIKKVHVPILIVAGEKDPRTKLWESKSLFENANYPKELWIVPNVGHDNFFEKAKNEYEKQVFGFLDKHLYK